MSEWVGVTDLWQALDQLGEAGNQWLGTLGVLREQEQAVLVHDVCQLLHVLLVDVSTLDQ